MGVEVIEWAVSRAVELRGTVMLAVREDDRRWCAVCAAVDGSLELRVGEPGSLARRRERRRREAWLREHGFVEVIDAWANPIAFAMSARSCAQTLDDALREGLAVPAGADLVEVLVHPGVLGPADPPPPGASHAEHIRYALRALAQRGRGKLLIETGRPASAWAWAFVMDGELILSPESREDERNVSLADEDVAAAAEQLADGLEPGAPLFTSCMPLEPSDPPLL